MHQKRAELLGFFSHHARRDCINRSGGRLIRFGAVDGRIGGCIDDHVRMNATDRSANFIRFTEIELLPLERSQLAQPSQERN